MSKEWKTGMQKLKKDEIRLLVEAKKEHRLLLMSKANVIGLGIGLRTRGGKVVDEPVVKVYVSRKIQKAQLSQAQLLPATLDVAGKKVRVDVEEAKIPRIHHFTLRSRPLVGGSSIGPTAAGFQITGTLGVCVTLDDDQTYILSNNHVLSCCDQLQIGSAIAQPSIPDGGSVVNDVIATLSNLVPIDFGTTTVNIFGMNFTIPNQNYVDCALARVQRPLTPPNAGPFNSANREIHWIGYPAFRIRSIDVGGSLFDWLEDIIGLITHPVHKMGRTTEYRVGTIVDASYDGYIDYSPAFGNPLGTNLAWFENQLMIDGGNRPFSMPGDSGSLVLDAESNQPVGLLFAGSGNTAIANHIDRVMEALSIPRI